MKLNIQRKKTTVKRRLLRKYIIIFILVIWLKISLVYSMLRSASFVIID